MPVMSAWPKADIHAERKSLNAQGTVAVPAAGDQPCARIELNSVGCLVRLQHVEQPRPYFGCRGGTIEGVLHIFKCLNRRQCSLGIRTVEHRLVDFTKLDGSEPCRFEQSGRYRG